MRRLCRFGIAGFVGVFLLLSGVAAQAQVVSISPPSLDFGTQQVGVATASQSVTITNTGTAVLTFTSIKLAGTNTKDFSPLTHNCASGVRPNNSCTITVMFTPQANGARSANISLTDNAPGSPQSVPLTGVGGTPTATLSPTSLTFSSQNVGSTSAAQNITLSNTGSAPMSITSIAASGDFAQTNNCPASLGNGGSCSISVTFTPTVAGTRTGTVSVTDSAAGSPQSVSLTGTGVSTSATVSLTPSTLTYASQTVGTTSAAQIAILTNTGTTAVSITSIAASGDFAQTNGCGSSLAVGANCSISVTFTPTVAGTRTGTLTVTDSASGSPHTVSLSGTGTAAAPAVSFSPTSLSFANQIVLTSSATQSVTMTNTGTGFLTVSGLGLGGTNAADFAPLSHNCTAGLAAGASCTITLKFTPSAVGLRTAVIQVTDNAANSPQTVAISGTGINLTSIAVTPSPASFALGQSQQFTATGTYSDGSTQNLTSSVAWSSSNPAIAVSATGLATATATGTATITATSGTVFGTASLTVNPATLLSIAVTPANPAVAKGQTQQFTATGTYSDGSTQNLTGTVTWSSSNLGTATIAAGGLATSVAQGTTTITATSGSVNGSTSLTVNAAALVSIAVTPANPTIAKGQTQQFTATGTYTDGTTQNLTSTVTWGASNTAAATIAPGGLATGVGAGTTTIAATSGGINGTTSLTVTVAVLNSIAVTPSPASFSVGQSLQFTATGTYSDGTTQNLSSTAAWSSSNPSIAVSATGLATATAPGSATITATVTGVSGNASLTVTGVVLTSIAVTPASPSIIGIGTQQMTATGTYSDGSTQNMTSSVTWSSSNPAVATISAGGLVTGVAQASGSVTITASSSGGSGTVSGTATVTVTAATLTAISLSPTSATIPKGQSQQFTATGTYNDTSTRDITSSVTWTSGNIAYFTVSATGLVTSVATGTSFVTATSGSVTSSASVTISQKALTQIAVTPANPSVADGVTQQFTATGTYSDGSTQNISSSVTWTSSNTNVATVNFSGSAPTFAQGSTTITAALGTVSGSTTLTVTAPTLSSITVTPALPTVVVGGTQQFTATGNYTDGSTQNLTNTATWTSSATKTATISATGLATTKAAGTTTITATQGTIKGTTTLTVVAAGTVIVTLSPRNASVTTSQTQQFTATVTGTSNTAVTWTVDGISGGNATVGTISASGLYTPPATTGAHVVRATSQANTSVSATANMYTTTFPGMFVYKYDQLRTGQNLNEPALTTTNVATSTFGKLFSCAVDGPVYGQPLYYANLAIAGGVHNVLYVVTMNDTAYAFDADSSSCQILWQQNFLQSGEIPLPITDINPSCGEVPQINVGILGTPVLDPTSGKLYFIVATKNISVPTAPTYHHRIYGVDVLTGNVLAGPTEITATVPGTGEGSVNGSLTFDPKMHKSRPALTLLNGVIYTGFGGQCDTHPYHGWLFGFDANTLAITNVITTSPDSEGSGVWMGGGGFSVDPAGNMYLVTGDGPNTGVTGGTAWGDSFLRLQPFNGGFNVLDYFTPSNQASLDNNNNDLGSSGLLLLPDQPGNVPHLAVSGGKDAVLHLVNRDQMGGYNAGFDNNLQDIVLPQKLKVTPSYWNGYVYVGARTDSVRQYQVTITAGQPSLVQTQVTSVAPGYPGTAPVIAAASPTATTGVAFFLNNTNFANGVAYLYAVDATNVSKQLWVSTQAANNRDQLHNAVKYTIPTVANGKVYVGTQGFIDVFGLLP